MAFEYWTDGWREGSLMPNDEGMRRCKCGRFLLIKDTVEVGTAETSDLPHMEHVADEALGGCIANADSPKLEPAARSALWHYLNHPFRAQYRQHRDAEEATTKAAWDTANPDRRNWWDRLLRRQAPRYVRPRESPFTYPAFRPSPEQQQNMQRLTALLASHPTVTGHAHRLKLAELYREQGRFDDAMEVIQSVHEREVDVTSKLILLLINERQSAPTRYRM